MKRRAEAFLDHEITSVVHGRPVRFVDDDDFADIRAENLLESIAKKVGFRDVAFVYEPIAAAYQYEDRLAKEETVLVADLGGGTSDFTVVRVGPERRKRQDRKSDILASAGTRIGGTDFDAKLSLREVMPLLGYHTRLRTKDLPIPSSLFFDLATWATINFAYGYQNERDVAAYVEDAVEPERLARLQTVIQQRLGHRVAMSVENAKIALSDQSQASIDLEFIEGRLFAGTTRSHFDESLEESIGRLQSVASECVQDAGLSSRGVDSVFFTGGSSRIAGIREAILRAVPNAAPASGNDMISVAMGLTIEAQRRFG
jgi:hypothetical chaperone protein